MDLAGAPSESIAAHAIGALLGYCRLVYVFFFFFRAALGGDFWWLGVALLLVFGGFTLVFQWF